MLHPNTHAIASALDVSNARGAGVDGSKADLTGQALATFLLLFSAWTPLVDAARDRTILIFAKRRGSRSGNERILAGICQTHQVFSMHEQLCVPTLALLTSLNQCCG